jgi:hypothetical protein
MLFGTKSISGPALSKARTVLKGAPDLAQAVLTGSVGIDAAYDETQKRDGGSDDAFLSWPDFVGAADPV